MKYKYYNETMFKHIVKLVKENKFEKAEAEYQAYLVEYPNDCCSYIYYAELLIKIGRFEQAQEILDKVLVNPNLRQITLEDTYLLKVKMLSSLQNYEEAYKVLVDNWDVFDSRNWTIKGIDLFLRGKLGLLTEEDMHHNSYLLSQIVDYSEELCLEHITKHQSYAGNDNPCIFNEDIPVTDLYYKLRKMLPLEDKIYHSITDNLYIFKYDNCGRVDGKLVDYMKVITLQGSNDIITMLPCKNNERIVHKDLTPVIVDKSSKVKRISQIDKFNQRYLKN